MPLCISMLIRWFCGYHTQIDLRTDCDMYVFLTYMSAFRSQLQCLSDVSLTIRSVSPHLCGLIPQHYDKRPSDLRLVFGSFIKTSNLKTEIRHRDPHLNYPHPSSPSSLLPLPPIPFSLYQRSLFTSPIKTQTADIMLMLHQLVV